MPQRVFGVYFHDVVEAITFFFFRRILVGLHRFFGEGQHLHHHRRLAQGGIVAVVDQEYLVHIAGDEQNVHW